MISGQLALITAALFTGAAIYVSAVEHPARMTLEPGAMLAEWKPIERDDGDLGRSCLHDLEILLGDRRVRPM